jgi:hypothetical protein
MLSDMINTLIFTVSKYFLFWKKLFQKFYFIRNKIIDNQRNMTSYNFNSLDIMMNWGIFWIILFMGW